MQCSQFSGANQLLMLILNGANNKIENGLRCEHNIEMGPSSKAS